MRSVEIPAKTKTRRTSEIAVKQSDKMPGSATLLL